MVINFNELMDEIKEVMVIKLKIMYILLLNIYVLDVIFIKVVGMLVSDINVFVVVRFSINKFDIVFSLFFFNMI